MIRLLVIGEEEREAAHKVALYAAFPENHYRPGPGAAVPGDNPNFVVMLGSFRCVFTFTVVEKVLYRSVARKPRPSGRG